MLCRLFGCKSINKKRVTGQIMTAKEILYVKAEKFMSCLAALISSACSTAKTKLGKQSEQIRQAIRAKSISNKNAPRYIFTIQKNVSYNLKALIKQKFFEISNSGTVPYLCRRRIFGKALMRYRS